RYRLLLRLAPPHRVHGHARRPLPPRRAVPGSRQPDGPLLMRTAASVRLAVSLLSATVLHGVAFAAIVLSGAPATPVAAPAPLDVDVVEVTPRKPDPLAEAAPRPALVPAKLVVAV